jgi:hypothetical protein
MIDSERRRPESVPRGAYCLGACGRNTIDDRGAWMVIVDDYDDRRWCEECWRELSPHLTQQERDAAGPWAIPDW